jgi:hypothetical protein
VNKLSSLQLNSSFLKLEDHLQKHRHRWCERPQFIIVGADWDLWADPSSTSSTLPEQQGAYEGNKPCDHVAVVGARARVGPI